MSSLDNFDRKKAIKLLQDAGSKTDYTNHSVDDLLQDLDDYDLEYPSLIDEIIRASQASPCAVDPIKDRAAFDALPRERQIELQATFVQ